MARVFLCDDSDLFRTVARVQLEARGHEVVGEGGDAGACITGVRESLPEVVLLDHVLPTPLDLAELRRAMPNARVILYAGTPQPDVEREGAIVGADAALSKASSFDELAALVRTLADGSPA